MGRRKKPEQALVPARRMVVVLADEWPGFSGFSWPGPFAAAFYDWAKQWGSAKKENTWRVYRVAIWRFFSFCEKVGVNAPDQVTTTHITSWIETLQEEGLSEGTIRGYFHGCKSFFNSLLDPRDTKGTMLIQSNPFGSTVVKKSVPRVRQFRPKKGLREMEMEHYRAMLESCDRGTLRGKRDYALLRLLFHTSRRRAEVAGLLYRDFGKDHRGPWVRFVSTKGDDFQLIEIPPTVWQDVQTYWSASKRDLKPESPAFVATRDNGKYLLRARGLREKEGEVPLTPSAIDQMLKSRAKEAGIDTSEIHIHIHGIRALIARAMEERGFSLKKIKERLGHKNLNTTDIYLGALRRVPADGWEDLEAYELGGPTPES